MLTPRSDDPNREKEKARIKLEPHTAGMPPLEGKEREEANKKLEAMKNADTKK